MIIIDISGAVNPPLIPDEPFFEKLLLTISMDNWLNLIDLLLRNAHDNLIKFKTSDFVFITYN